ncbi:MAG TPA: TetR/AcrR family transcriptional regulator [Magnetospirillaceae bacterium]|jgi:AcrR family transcriptional regulator
MLRKAPQQARSRYMVDVILEGATRVFSERPYAEITTAHIAEVSGVSIGSLYQYFGAKEAIAASLQQRHCAETLGLVRSFAAGSGGKPLHDRLRDMLGELLILHRDAPLFHRNLLGLWPYLPAPLPQADQLNGGIMEAVGDMLAEEWPERGQAELLLQTTMVVRGIETLTHAAVRLPELADDETVFERFEMTVPAVLAARAQTQHAPALR